jgi:hypothetical protein
MKNDVDFLTEIVLPTVEEFSRNPGDIRLGVLACLVLQAMNEHYFRHNRFDPNRSDKENSTELANFKRALRAKDWAFGQIMDIANHTKHALKRFFDLHHETPGVLGIARAGFPMTSGTYVFINEDNAWLLYQLTEHVAQSWKVKLGIV